MLTFLTIHLGLELLIIEENTQTITYTQQVGVVLGEIINRLHLLFQEMFFQIVAEMGIIVGSSNFVQIQE